MHILLLFFVVTSALKQKGCAINYFLKNQMKLLFARVEIPSEINTYLRISIVFAPTYQIISILFGICEQTL